MKTKIHHKEESIVDRRISFFSMVLIISMLFTIRGNAQSTTATDYFPVVTTGDQFPDFSGVAVDELFLFAYRNGNWEMIPSQLDERSSQGDYFFPDDIPGLDDNDEFSFLAADVGDYYPSGSGAWIANPESRLYPRYQITVTDSTTGMMLGYVYLYRSNTLTSQTADYIEYRPGPPQTTAADTVLGPTFTLAHHEKGFLDYLVIPTSLGGSGTDLLDRQKFRIEIDFSFPILINEDDFQNAMVLPDSVLDGSVRILKLLNLEVVIFGSSVPLSLFMKYFPYSVQISSELNLSSLPLQVLLIRQSLDFNESAIGMSYYDMNVPAGVMIDGTPDAVPLTPVLFAPQVNWNHITGSQGTVVELFRFTPLGTTTFGRYYKDEDVIDPDDTGDGKSFGDNGFLITNLQAGASAMPLDINGFFLAPNLPSTLGEDLAELQEFPPGLDFEVQTYSSVSGLEITANNQAITYALWQNFPNPFNPTTIINYQLAVGGPVNLSVFNLVGQKVATLIAEKKPAGSHQVEFSATNLASGIYLYRLEAGGFVRTRKMIVMR